MVIHWQQFESLPTNGPHAFIIHGADGGRDRSTSSLLDRFPWAYVVVFVVQMTILILESTCRLVDAILIYPVLIFLIFYHRSLGHLFFLLRVWMSMSVHNYFFVFKK